MFPHFCNHCFRECKYYKTLKLHVSRCGHVLCTDCVRPSCRICSRPMESVPLNNQMPNGMADYFADPLKHYRHFQKIYKFHNEQEKLYVQHFCQHFEENTKRLQKHLQGFMKMHGALTAELANEQERIEKCQAYLSYYERKSSNDSNAMQMAVPRPQPRLRYPPSRTLYPDVNQRNDNPRSSSSSSNFLFGDMKLQMITPPPRTPSISTTNGGSTSDQASRCGGGDDDEDSSCSRPRKRFPAPSRRSTADHRVHRTQSMFTPVGHCLRPTHASTITSSTSTTSNIQKFPF